MLKNLQELSSMESDQFFETVPQIMDMEEIIVPAATQPVRHFSANRTDPLEAIPLVRKAGILDAALEQLTPREQRTIRPLTPLDNGHLALMLAGGYMNGEINKDGKRLVIKGMVNKSEEVKDSNDNRVVTKDVYKPSVQVIDLNTAELLIVQ